MRNREILNVFEALLRSSQHPGIKQIHQYGPGVGGLEGVKVLFEWDAQDYAWAYLFVDGADRKPAPKPFLAKAPFADVPDSKNQGATVEKWLMLDYFLKLVRDLCDTATPGPLTGWVPVALQDVGAGHGPVGLGVTCTDGTKLVVRATIGSGPTGDPKSDPWSEYVIPVEEVKTWQKQLMGTPKEPVRL